MSQLPEVSYKMVRSHQGYLRYDKKTIDTFGGMSPIRRRHAFGDGDFVECGVSSGLSSEIMCDYLYFDSEPKT
jgi:hypothetical protein